MDLESAQNNVATKLPLLKQGEFEMWKLRIEQYFQVQDYALWDVTKNDNSFKPVARTIANANGTSTLTIPGPVTTEEKAQKKNDVKVRSMLLMVLPNEHLLTFNQYKDAQTLFAAIHARFGVSTVNTPVSTPSTHDNTAKLSDDTVYVFLANYPNGSQLVHEDLEQIHEDDLEGMDLKWQLALLSMRARRECKGSRNQESRPKNQDNRNWNQDSSKRTIHVEDTSSKAMVTINRADFDWSFMVDEEAPTNMAFMAFSDSEPEFEGYGPKVSKSIFVDTLNEVKKTPDASLVKELVSQKEKQTVFPTKKESVKQQEKTVRKPVKYTEMHRS
ncbi:hypothetical protein Tco_0806175 [Tanacetum coccineum]